jgi:hypothetical protein
MFSLQLTGRELRSSSNRKPAHDKSPPSLSHPMGRGCQTGEVSTTCCLLLAKDLRRAWRNPPRC